jgi:8-oxo-dGTP pyrophosphatase MutT (NUDIX family)
MPRPHRHRASRRSLPTVEETSAGGLVVDRSGLRPVGAVIARVNRAGRVEWCLPKGHLENDETPEQAAVR